MTERTDNGGFPSSIMSFNPHKKKPILNHKICEKSTILVPHLIIFLRYRKFASVNQVTAAWIVLNLASFYPFRF